MLIQLEWGGASREAALCEPAPTETRAQVLGQHAALRRRLATLRHASLDVTDHNRCQLDLRRELLAFATELAEHLAFEERVLLPLVRRIDAWGPQRSERMLAEHARQRCTLAGFVAACEGESWMTQAFAERVGRLVADVLEDIAFEEEGLLDADLLRDDLVAIDQTDG